MCGRALVLLCPTVLLSRLYVPLCLDTALPCCAAVCSCMLPWLGCAPVCSCVLLCLGATFPLPASALIMEV